MVTAKPGMKWSRWLIGLLLGALIGFLAFLGGWPAIAIGLALAGVGLLFERSLAYLSGLLVGWGGIWLAVLARVVYSCGTTDALPGQPCPSSGTVQFMVIAAIILGVGVVLGVLALRRGDGSGSGSGPESGPESPSV